MFEILTQTRPIASMIFDSSLLHIFALTAARKCRFVAPKCQYLTCISGS